MQTLPGTPQSAKDGAIGFDCSHNNSDINWSTISPEFKFVFIKCSQGYNFIDPMYTTRVRLSKQHNLIVGSYHFLTAIDSAQDQANNFLSTYIDGTMIALDVEDQVPASLNVNITKNKHAFIQLIKDWISIVEEKTGKTVILYSYKNFFRDYLNNVSDFGKQPLWLASYQSQQPTLPPGFDKYTFWQYTEFGKLDGSITGGEYDLDLFNGTLEELNKL